MNVNSMDVERLHVCKERQENPHFRHIERAPYELGYLLLDLPEGINQYEKQTEEAYLKAEAAALHADNAAHTLLFGLQAVGSLMASAGCSDEVAVERGTLSALGSLIEHLACEMQFLGEVEDRMRAVTRSRDQGVFGVTGGR